MTLKFLTKSLFGVKGCAIVSQEVDEVSLVATLTVKMPGRAHRCPFCGKASPVYDSRGYREWRSLDCGPYQARVRMEVRRVSCPDHGVAVEEVPFAHHGSRFTKDFEDLIAYAAIRLPKAEVARMLRVSWHTVGPVMERALSRVEPDRSARLDGIRVLSIDEKMIGKAYYMVFGNQDTGDVVHIEKKREKESVVRFLKMLSEEQRRSIRIVTGDGAEFIRSAVAEVLGDKVAFCIDPFHVMQWVTEAVGKLKKKLYDTADFFDEVNGKRRDKATGEVYKTTAEFNKASTRMERMVRFTLFKREESLGELERALLKQVKSLYPKIGRAHALKERMSAILKGATANPARDIDSWVRSCRRLGGTAFTKLADSIAKVRAFLVNTIIMRASNGFAESINSLIQKAITRANGFRSEKNAIALVYIVCGPAKDKIRLPFDRRPAAENP